MSESALDRTARALDLVPYLLEHQGISITELAKVFGTSEKQINEDLILIHMCGLPGYTPLELIDMYYEDGFVTVSDPQSLDRPRKMSRTEMSSILVSLDLIKSLRTDEIGSEIEALQRKLQNNLEFENPFVVVQELRQQPVQKILESAIAKSAAVEIVYLGANRDTRSERKIIPIEIYIANKIAYLNAWCETSNGDRTFRLDRILSCEPIPGRALVTRSERTEIDSGANSIILTIDKSARNFLEDNRAIINKIDGVDEATVSLNSIDEEWLIKTVLGYGGSIRVISPEAISLKIADRAREILEIYGENSGKTGK